jgi:predicted nucleic-acid-binding protein
LLASSCNGEHSRLETLRNSDRCSHLDEAMLLRALELYEVERPDFAEAYLVAAAEVTGVGTVMSCDRGIDRIATVSRIEPRTSV